MADCYHVDDLAAVPSPALLIFRAIVRSNIESMIALAGGIERLRPHLKTHKMPALVRLLEARGISKHKCATIAEAEMAAAAGARDVLLAYPLLGPNLARWVRLMEAYPTTVFRAVVDDAEPARALARAVLELGSGRPCRVLVDIDVGMGRTGIAPELAADLYRLVATLPGLEPDGLHVYDGHVRDTDPVDRRRSVDRYLDTIIRLREQLLAEGHPVPRLVLGGTPTFPMHAANRAQGVEYSPGTALLYDHSYASKFSDLPFEPAALLLTRVISRPRHDRVCLDAGYKAVSADPVGDRLRLLGLNGTTLGPQSEEHLVVLGPEVGQLALGAPLLAIPTHICPTCALHKEALIIDEGQVVDRWEVTARDRVLLI